MNFSDVFKQSGHLCKFSPDASYLANATQYRLVIRNFKTLQIKALFTCLDNINYIEWSPDSLFILCALLKRGFIQVWSLEKPEWTCKIGHGSMGLLAARWTPDSRHILSTSDFKLRISVWSLILKTVSYIKYPKHSNKGIAFSPDGKHLAVAERRNFKDYVTVFASESWEMLQHFAADTKDLSDLSWSPNGSMLAVWDTKLEYKLFVYSLDGRFISSFSAYDFALGIKTVTWSPSNQFLAIGSYDQSVRMLNNITWMAVCDFKHDAKINSRNVIIYEEGEKKGVTLPWESKEGKKPFSSSQYVIKEAPYTVPIVRPDPEKPNPKLGVGTVLFNHDNRYVATKNDNMPNVVWIWSVVKLKLYSVMVQCYPVKAMSWDPRQTRLAVCSGTNKVYVWSLDGCLSAEVPMQDDFFVSTLTWHQSGDVILLTSKDQMCMCYLATAPDE